jgi:ATP-dependent helicase/DNAse subunit B
MGYPGFARALATTLGQIRLAGIDPDTLAAAGPEQDLAGLLHRYQSALAESRLADQADLLELARKGLDSPEHAHLATAPLVLLDVPIRSAAERDLVAALVARAPEALVTVPAGDGRTRDALLQLGGQERVGDDPEPTERSLDRLRAHLFTDGTPPSGDPDEHVEFFSAPGEGRECVEIARKVAAAARDGVPFDEIAVFLRAPAGYAALLETAFRRAGVPAYFARGTTRPDPAGRAFLALLTCKAERLSARRFAEYLSFSQVPDLDGEGGPPTDRAVWAGPADETLVPVPVIPPPEATVQLSLFGAGLSPRPAPAPPAADAPTAHGSLRAPWKWEEYLVEAAVIGGKDRWRERLRGFERELELKLATLYRDEPESHRLEKLRRDRANLDHLERFALPVIDFLDALPAATPWGQWRERLAMLAGMVLRDPERVLSVLAELAPMDKVGPITIDEVREVLADRLANLERPRPETRYGKVFVATPEVARARTFRVVFVPGLAERIFPQRPREDPLLLDARRREVSGDLDTQEERGAEERLSLRLAVGAARERVVFSYPRLDVVQARPRVRSFYGLDVARAVRGRIPGFDELEREAADEVGARLAWPAPVDPDDAIDTVEHDLAVLGSLLKADEAFSKGRARYLLEQSPPLDRSLRTRYKRWNLLQWTDADGLKTATDRTRDYLATQRPGQRPYSVTALQRYAACPYQFLLAGIHRLEPRPDAVALIRLDPLTRGRMFHEIQAETFRALQGRGFLPLKPADHDEARTALDAVVDRVAARYRDELAPAIPRVWEDEIDGIRADLRTWLRRLSESDDGWVPIHFELAFGLGRAPASRGQDPASSPEPVRLPGGWKLRGAVDVVESRGGELRVTDHKTGADRTLDGLRIGGGQTLQPVLYAQTVAELLKKAVTEGRLYFATARGRFGERVVPLDDFVRDYARQAMEIIDRAVQDGRFLTAPQDERTCQWCDFRTVCGSTEARRVSRKLSARGRVGEANGRLLADLTELRRFP